MYTHVYMYTNSYTYVFICLRMFMYRASHVALVVKNPPANAGDLRDTGLIPGSGRSPRGGHGNPLQYSFLENPQGQMSLMSYSSWGHQELDTTE